MYFTAYTFDIITENTGVSWTVVQRKKNEIPIQNQFVDCGVFLCMFAKAICFQIQPNFCEEDCSFIRRKIVWELFNGMIV